MKKARELQIIEGTKYCIMCTEYGLLRRKYDKDEPLWFQEVGETNDLNNDYPVLRFETYEDALLFYYSYEGN